MIGAGVGLAAMVFALADPYALRELPYAHPDRLVSITFGLPSSPSAWTKVSPDELPSLASWQARTDLFEAVAAFEDRDWVRAQLFDRVVPLRSVAATNNLLETLGVGPQRSESDEAAVWLSNLTAKLRLGRELRPGDSVPVVPAGTLHVVGILPSTFVLPIDRTEPVDMLVTLPTVSPVIRKTEGSSQWLNIVARTRVGVAAPVVEAALRAGMPAGSPVLSVLPLPLALTARLRALAVGALLASGLIVLVCWANVFSIALTRGFYRGRELATRAALGASWTRIVVLLLTDGLKIAALGGAIALIIAWQAIEAIALVLPPQLSTLGVPTLSRRVVFVIIASTIVAGASWSAASILAWTFGMEHRGKGIVGRDGRTIRAVRFILIAGQLGAACVLLTGSLLLARSYLNLLAVDSGMDAQTQTLTVAHDPSVPLAQRREVVERTVAALRSVEGVQAAGASFGNLLDGRSNRRGVVIDGQLRFLDWTFVAGDYFKAMGLQFLAGVPPKSGQVVVTEAAARDYFVNGTPLGQVLSPGTADVSIVGIVRDVRSRSLSVPGRPAVYGTDGGWGGDQPQTTYVMRVSANSAAVAAWEHAVLRVDPMAAILDSGAVRDRLDRSVSERIFATIVVGLFAVASVLVAALGLAGVVAHTVVKRTREMAIRLTLGATIGRVVGLVARDALIAAACGVLTGTTASIWLSRVLDNLLFGIRPTDPTTILLTGASLLVVVAAAATLPALSAARIEPAGALRID